MMNDVEFGTEGILAAVTIPVMAKAWIEPFVKVQILQNLGVDYVDESEVLTPADDTHHIDRWKYTVPFVGGAITQAEELRRPTEGAAAMIRSKSEGGIGVISNATGHMRKFGGEIRLQTSMSGDELFVAAMQLRAPYDLVVEVARAGKLPVTPFTAGGVAAPSVVAMMMQPGGEGVLVGSGIFKSGNPRSVLRDRRGRHLLALRRPGRAGQGFAECSVRRWPKSTTRASFSRTASPNGVGSLRNPIV